MLDKIFQPVAQIEICTAEDYLLPGTTASVEVAVCPEQQLNPKEVRLELTMHSNTKVISVLKDQTFFPPGVTSTCKFDILIPADAPPTCHGKKVWVDWQLRATLDMPGWHELVRFVSVPMMSTPAGTGGTDTYSLVEKSYKDCILSFNASAAKAGGEVSGQLQVKALKEFQVSGIRVELKQIEEVKGRAVAHGFGKAGMVEPDKGRVEVNEVVARQDISGPVSFDTVNSLSFNFSLPVPSNVPPTMTSPYGSLYWRVRAVLGRKMQRDFNIEKDVFIYNADAPVE